MVRPPNDSEHRHLVRSSPSARKIALVTIASIALSVLLAVALLASGVMKVRRAPAVVDSLTPLGVPERVIPALGTLELAATLGLLLGLFWWPLGLAASVGTILYFVGAIVAHLRAHDNAIAPAAGYLLFSIVTLAVILLAQ